MKKKFYITTPIYYPNASPHIGSVYSTLLADIIARYKRLMGEEVVFLTGTDEHGQKVYEAATKAGKETQLFVDEIAGKFESVFKKWNLSYTIFMRTTNTSHKTAVQEWILILEKKGFIYKSFYQGWYCVSAEEFLLEKDCVTKDASGAPISPLSGKPAIWLKQEAYFFKLSHFQEQLLLFFENHKEFIIPQERTLEVINFIKEGLKDLCISRLKKDVPWGIPFPGAEDHVIYVWADALNNYITGVGYLFDKANFENTWPADIHVMAKDIFRFHAIYWLAFLMAADLPLPKHELIHGWLLVDNKKMSKSLGNVIDPEEILKTYELDTVRYYLASLSTSQDATFSYEDLEQKYQSDLVDNLSNLLQRVTVLAKKKGIKDFSAPTSKGEEERMLQKKKQELYDFIEKELHTTYGIHKIIQEIIIFSNALNSYFHHQEPWKSKDEEKFKTIIYSVLEGLFAIGVYLLPIMPEKMAVLFSKLSLDHNNLTFSDALKTFIFSLTENETYLFQKKEIKKEIEIPKEAEIMNPSFPPITIDEFLKSVILVGEIKKVSEIPKSDKLYLFTVDFGTEGIREIAGGVKLFYQKEELLGKKTIFSFNLAPRKLCGITSHGMTLMAKNETGKPELIIIPETVLNGTRIG